MRSLWYRKIYSDPSDLSNFVECVPYFEEQIEEALSEVKIRGNINQEAAELPGLMAYRHNQLQEVESILQLLSINLKRTRSKVFKRFLENYNKSLSSRDAEKYADADQDVCDLEFISNRIAFLRNEYQGIMKSFEVKHWQLSNIVKLKTSGFEDFNITKSE